MARPASASRSAGVPPEGWSARSRPVRQVPRRCARPASSLCIRMPARSLRPPVAPPPMRGAQQDPAIALTLLCFEQRQAATPAVAAEDHGAPGKDRFLELGVRRRGRRVLHPTTEPERAADVASDSPRPEVVTFAPQGDAADEMAVFIARSPTDAVLPRSQRASSTARRPRTGPVSSSRPSCGCSGPSARWSPPTTR